MTMTVSGEVVTILVRHRACVTSSFEGNLSA